jgi:rubrerythrin
MAEPTPLEYAIQLERDGLAFYAEAAETTRNPLGKKMFEGLAADERRHEQVLRAVADEMAVELPADTPQERIVTLFAELGDQIKHDLGADPEDTAVVERAIEFEKRAAAYFAEQAGQTDSDRDKALFERLALEERQHVAILENTLTYLTDSGHWFLWDEGAVLDGG